MLNCISLFRSTFTDLEDTAQGNRRGFYIISYDDEMEKIRADFNEIKIVDIIFNSININQYTVKQVEEKINSIVEEMENLTGNIVLIKIIGKRSDIIFSRLKEKLSAKGALLCYINKNNLFSQETIQIKVSGDSIEDIEEKVIGERIVSFKIDPSISDDKVKNFIQSILISEQGKFTANELLLFLKKESIENDETVTDFEKKVFLMQIVGFRD